ncbi:hypothetical protein ACGFZS_32380 [Streptomyces sp. NPDC048288]|uniref:hypothetical protein n=1 Tax=Streptomyces sp. NPDC048288 TaxID=3365529 RepID=UPI00371664F8
MRGMFFDISFIGVSGISTKAGITTFDVREAMKKKIIIANSTRSYVLADSAKFGRSSSYKVTDLKDAFIITDQYNEILGSAAEHRIAKPEET